MKSTTYTIFIGIVIVFFALLFYIPDEINIKIVEKSEDVLESFDEAPLHEGRGSRERDKEVFAKDEVEVTPSLVELEPKKLEVIAEVPDAVPAVKQEVIVEQPTVPQVEELEEVQQISFSKINEVTREALVNIFCTTKSGGSFKPITGSGVVIDERGIILTNAHVAQYYLLENYLTEGFISCVIRIGSPAKPVYKAKPIFISPSWVKANANGIIQQEPKGTGEDDYALLLITERTDPNKTIPETFSFIPPLYNSSNIAVGNNVLLAGYPAGFLSGVVISKNLYISSTVTQIVELFTFKDGTLDLFSIGGSVVAQQGSSGGAVVDGDNKLLGIIVTSSVADTTAERDLRAITIAHINRSFMKDTGFDLQTLFISNISAEANAFNENIAPILTQLLVDELEK